MTRGTRFLARLVVPALVAGAAGLVGITTAAAPAAAATCSGSGVSVVVDPGSLGGGVRTACASGGAGQSASSLFSGSGFSLAYVQNEPGFVCRIDQQPAPSEQACVTTPPSDAYWGLWWSDGKSGTWNYSNYGVGSLEGAGRRLGRVRVAGQQPYGARGGGPRGRGRAGADPDGHRELGDRVGLGFRRAGQAEADQEAHAQADPEADARAQPVRGAAEPVGQRFDGAERERQRGAHDERVGEPESECERDAGGQRDAVRGDECDALGERGGDRVAVGVLGRPGGGADDLGGVGGAARVGGAAGDPAAGGWRRRGVRRTAAAAGRFVSVRCHRSVGLVGVGCARSFATARTAVQE